MTTTDISQGADATVTPDEADIVAAANEEAKQVLARSRYEAFRLVTEARAEAETILDEARAEAAGTIKAATITAESKVDAAEIRASEIVETAESRAEQLLSSSESIEDAEPASNLDTSGATNTLEAEHEELAERVSSLRVLADQLEHRFAALASTSPEPPVEQSGQHPSARPAIDYSPSVPAKEESKAEEDSSADEPEERGSFYSRRSAKLPSIGAAGGQSALDMTRSIRSKLESD